MIGKFVLAAILVAAPVSGLQAMNVALFLQKADALEKKGMRAMFSSDYRLLKNEVTASFTALRAERLAAERAGRRGAYCPPKKVAISTRELLAGLRAIPAAQRSQVEVKDGLRTFLARKFPCRG
jgi:hypothetical protein